MLITPRKPHQQNVTIYRILQVLSPPDTQRDVTDCF